MQYRLSCPECQKVHLVSTVQAGDEIQCSCNAIVHVPLLREMKSLPSALEEEATAKREKTASVWKTWRGPAIAITTGIGVVFAFVTLRFLLQLAVLDTSYTMETEISAGNELFDQYSPEELSLVWNNFEEFGIGPKQMPDYEVVRRFALARKSLATVNGSIAGGFFFAAFGIWLSARSAAKKLKKTP
ncbi:MAG: hypothetical protein Aurels2KO_18160 [Aureliella sp.]